MLQAGEGSSDSQCGPGSFETGPSNIQLAFFFSAINLVT